MQKTSLFHLFILQIESFLESTPTPKIFNVLLICMNLYQHAKNQLILEIQ